MKTLLTGADGQLGTALRLAFPKDFVITALSSSELDITDAGQTEKCIEEFCPDIIINAAAYTAVDLAESEPERAFAVNAGGPENIARAAGKLGIRLIHISTDFVFDGRKSSPYLPQDTPAPLNVYGKSKLEGEKAILRLVPDTSLIIRTSWLYSVHGKNFVKTMLSLMETRDTLRVVADQAGTPTSARGLAEAVWRAADIPKLCGIMHWSDSGIASWYDFACVIAAIALKKQIISQAPKIIPVNTANYPTPAARPAYSVLDKQETMEMLGLIPPHWQANLEKMLNELAASGKEQAS